MSETNEAKTTENQAPPLTGRDLVKFQAERRAGEILYAKERIERRLENNPGDPRAEDLKKRLKEYDESLEIIEFTIRTGRYVTLKGGEPSESDTVVNVPTGNVNLEGKVNDR